MSANSVVMRALLEFYLFSIIFMYATGSAQAAISITQAKPIETIDEASNSSLLPDNTVITKDEESRNISHIAETNLRQSLTLQNTNVSQDDLAVSDRNSNETNLIAVDENTTNVANLTDKNVSVNGTENENNSIISETPITNDEVHATLGNHSATNALPLKAEKLEIESKPLTTGDDVTTVVPATDFELTSTIGPEEELFLESSLPTVNKAVEDKELQEASLNSTLPPALIFILVLLGLVFLEVALVNAVNWWKSRDSSARRRSVLSFFSLGLNRKHSEPSFVGPIDDTTPIVEDV